MMDLYIYPHVVVRDEDTSKRGLIKVEEEIPGCSEAYDRTERLLRGERFVAGIYSPHAPYPRMKILCKGSESFSMFVKKLSAALKSDQVGPAAGWDNILLVSELPAEHNSLFPALTIMLDDEKIDCLKPDQFRELVTKFQRTA